MTDSSEYKRFDRIVRKLLSVPHSEIKTKLDAEKRTKKKKRSLGIWVFLILDHLIFAVLKVYLNPLSHLPQLSQPVPERAHRL